MMNKFNLFLLSFTCIAFFSCSNDDDTSGEESGGKAKIVISTKVDGGSTAFIVPVKDLNVGTVGFNNGHEVYDGAYIESFGDWVFYNPTHYNATIKKYIRLENGLLSENGSLTLSSNAKANIGHILVVSETKAYASVVMDNKIIIFNPSTMAKTGEINLQDERWGVNGSSTPNPLGMILRDDILFVGCMELTSMPITKDGAYVLAIDAKTDTPIKLLSDQRGSSTSYFGGGMFTDEKGDIYVTCWASMGYGGEKQKSGFLRIKKGETEFDKDYFFNITDKTVAGVEGGKFSHSSFNHYYKNGEVYLFGTCPALVSNPPDYLNDKNIYAVKANLYDQTMEILDLPLTNNYSGVITEIDNKILFGLTTKSNGVGLFSYDPVAKESRKSPVLSTGGTVLDICVFEK